MIDRSWIGHTFDPLTVLVEAGRVRLFCKAIGETRPRYTDHDAAVAHGWPAPPVPPTMLFALEMEQPDPWGYLETLGIDLAHVLHGEQEFVYQQATWVGDTLTFHVSIEDIIVKRGGALELVTKSSSVTNQRGEPVAQLRTVLVVRNPEASS